MLASFRVRGERAARLRRPRRPTRAIAIATATTAARHRALGKCAPRTRVLGPASAFREESPPPPPAPRPEADPKAAKGDAPQSGSAGPSSGRPRLGRSCGPGACSRSSASPRRSGSGTRVTSNVHYGRAKNNASDRTKGGGRAAPARRRRPRRAATIRGRGRGAGAPQTAPRSACRCPRCPALKRR